VLFLFSLIAFLSDIVHVNIVQYLVFQVLARRYWSLGSQPEGCDKHNEAASRLPLLSARPVVTFPASEHCCQFHVCEQLARLHCVTAEWLGVEIATCRSGARHPKHYTTASHCGLCKIWCTVQA